jgi:hypothetical protein
MQLVLFGVQHRTLDPYLTAGAVRRSSELRKGRSLLATGFTPQHAMAICGAADIGPRSRLGCLSICVAPHHLGRGTEFIPPKVAPCMLRRDARIIRADHMAVCFLLHERIHLLVCNGSCLPWKSVRLLVCNGSCLPRRVCP